MMDIAQIRLEALKLAHRHDQLPEMVIDRAKAYEAFVTGTAKADESRQPTHGPTGQTGKTAKR
jgi:hypothetical protein